MELCELFCVHENPVVFEINRKYMWGIFHSFTCFALTSVLLRKYKMLGDILMPICKNSV